MENNWLNLMNLLKRILTSTEIVYHMKNKKIFNELIRERPSEFHNLEKRINLNNLIYKYKIEGKSPKDFRNYQDSINLFKNLRDVNVNPTEVLKNKINFKSDIGFIRLRNPVSKTEEQITVT